MTSEVIYNGNAQYLGKTMCGFISTYEYHIKITKYLYGYLLEGITNLTEEKECAGCLQYASQISLNQNWLFDKKLGFN